MTTLIKYLKSLIRFNSMKIDVAKGIRQCILMLIPLLVGYLTGHFSTGLLISTGTLAHIYVFGGPKRSKLRIVLFSSLGLSIAMILGTLTVNQPLIFGVLLLLVTVIPYYIFSSLNIPGPSSTFFIVAFSLPINLPVAPEEALTRGLAMFVGANYSFAVIFITIQVILLNGLASNHLTILIALPRIIDVIVGIIIAVICLLVIGRKTASSMLPGTLAAVARDESILFHYLFSSNKYASREQDKKEMLKLSVKLNNMTQVYNSANGELFSNKMVIQYYYPSIYALEEISFMLTRALSNEKRYHIDDETMGQYLLVFENIAKHFERGTNIQVQEMAALPQYTHIKTALMSIQNNCVNARKEVKLSLN